MTSFAPTPTFMALSGPERLRRAYERSAPFWETFTTNVGAGFETSFGLGTMLRELTAPPLLTDNPVRGDTPENLLTRQQRFKEEALSEEQYKASPSFREAVPWQRGMTEARAAHLARGYDKQIAASALANKNMLAGFAGQFLGQMFDPINYIPVFGQSAHIAAVAKAGSILGRAGMASAEAAINTAAFGIITAGIRRNFGDDVSMQAVFNEIAMSALIGGAFGAGIGVLARGHDARIRDSLASAKVEMDDIRTKVRSRETLARAASDLMDKGYVDLGPENVGNIEEAGRQVEARTLGVRQLEKETLDVVGDQPGQVVISPSGYRVNVEAKIVELADLKHANGALQVRDRSRTASERWVEETATQLNPALLRPDISSDRGAPLVGDDRIIDSGNGRVMALRRAYENYPERISEYRADLEKQGYDLTGFNQPVLVMQRTTPLSPEARAAFNADSNARISAEMSATEIADMDAAAMTDDVLALAQPGSMASRENASFVSRFIQNLPRNERGRFIDKDGNINADGLRRVENALISAAYGTADPLVIRRFTEATDDNSRAILGAMADVAPQWARIQRAIRRGDLDPDFDPAPALTEAVRMLNRFRDQAKTEKRPVSTVIREGLAQTDMLKTENLPARRMLEAFYETDQFTKALGREAIGTYLNRIAENVESLGQPQLFGRPGVSMHEVIENATASNASGTSVTAGDLGLGSTGLSPDRVFAIDVGLEEGGVRSIFEGTEAAPEAPEVERFVGGLSIQQSAETQGRDFVPTDTDMAMLESRLSNVARWGGGEDVRVKALSTEGRYGGIERSVDLEVSGYDYDPSFLWREMIREADNANQDSTFLAREVSGDSFDPIKHRPGVELQFANPVGRNALDNELEKLAAAGVEFYTVTVDGTPTKPGAMPAATGVRILYMPEFDRRYGGAEGMESLDNKGLSDHMLAKADEMDDLVANVMSQVEGVTGRVVWYEANVAFRGEYKEIIDGSPVAGSGPEASSGARGKAAWKGKSVREGIAAADRQLEWVAGKEAAGRFDEVSDFVEQQAVQAQQQQSFAGPKAKIADHTSLNEALDMAGYGDLFANVELAQTPEEIKASYDPRIATARERGNEKRAKTLESLRDEALRLAEVGANKPTAEAIFRKTGWFQGVDGKWRFEIDDREAKIKLDGFRPLGEWEQEGVSALANRARLLGRDPWEIKATSPLYLPRLDMVLHHPKLFAAYPQLRETKVQWMLDPDGPRYSGYYAPEENRMQLTATDEVNLRSAVLHEVAHIIQTGENWGEGGAPGFAGEVYEGEAVASWQEKIRLLEEIVEGAEKVRTELRKKPDFSRDDPAYKNASDAIAMAERELEKAETGLIDAAQYEAYMRRAGEVEARNVQARLDLMDDGRHPSELPPPWVTMDRPPGVQVVITQGIGRRWSAIAQEPKPVESPGELTRTELDELLDAAEAGDIDTIIASPMLKNAVKAMMEIERTDLVEGFGSVEWSESRTYIGDDGQEITGVVNAVNHLIDNARNLATNELGLGPIPTARERKAVIVIGPPAAGKSTVANQIAVRLRAAIPDSDEAKKIMPEYGTGLGANATHEESGLLSELVLQELAEEGSNMVIPKVGGKRDSIDDLSEYLQGKGYKVDVVLMDVPKEEAFRRMVNRFISTGRFIPPDYFKQVVDAPRKVFEELKASGKQNGHGKIVSDRGIPPFIRDGAFSILGYPEGAKVIEIAPRPRGDGGAPQPSPEVALPGQANLDLIGGEVKPVRAKPDPIPDGLVEAGARVGTASSVDELAEDFEIDIETGQSPEVDDVKQLDKEGRLTEQDRLEMAAAEANFKNAKAYANALDAARACVI